VTSQSDILALTEEYAVPLLGSMFSDRTWDCSARFEVLGNATVRFGFFAVKFDATIASEAIVLVYQTARCHVP
jgi:hypothetical protein